MPTTATVPRTRPRGEIRRSQILDAAVEVFLENGYGGATIDLVVERAGASKATVYSFFGGKDGLFAAIVEDAPSASFPRSATPRSFTPTSVMRSLTSRSAIWRSRWLRMR